MTQFGPGGHSHTLYLMNFAWMGLGALLKGDVWVAPRGVPAPVGERRVAAGRQPDSPGGSDTTPQ
jgi:hypothetical protein